MSGSHHHEYLELLRGAREHLSSHYSKGSFILADRENWEALRRVMMASKAPTPPTLSKNVAKPINTITPPLSPPLSSPVPTAAAKPPPTTIHQVPVTPKPATSPTSPPEKRVVEEKINRALTLVELGESPEIDFGPWKALFREKFPHVELVEPVANDKEKSESITIVYDNATPQELAFLQNVARTCHLLLGNTRLLPLNKFNPEAQKMVVSYGVKVENGFLLENLPVYLQSPRLKAQLWRQLSSLYMQKSS